MGFFLKLRWLGFLCLILLMCVSLVGATYVPYQEEWGIYKLNPSCGETQLIYSSLFEINMISLSPDGSTFVLSVNLGEGFEYSEIFTLGVDGSDLAQLTDNDYWNLYPIWSPDGSEILFLTFRETLDVYKMYRDGSDLHLFYDSGGHDGDIDWVDDHIVFTRNSQIWVMNSDGSDPHQLTDPPRAGEWGNAVLPFGDYDPRISPDGSLVVFERMVDDSSPHGNYDLYVIGIDGTGEYAVTDLVWTLGIARWSDDGESLIFQVSAAGEEGKYDVYSINVDGSGLTDLTGDLYPAGFLVHNPIYSGDDALIYFIGQWWDWKILSSALSCSVSTSTVTLGDTVVISGSVQPTVHDIDLTLTITGPDGSETSEVLNSEDDSYSNTFTPDALGKWSAQVSWDGDLGHSESVSDSVGFTVEEAETGGSGIPGYSLFAVFLGVALFLLVARRNHPTLGSI